MDDQLAQILVASLGDADQARLATGGNLSRYQPKPSREIAAAGEGLAIADGGYQRRCVQHADAGDGREAPRVRIVTGACGKLVVERGNPSVQLEPFRAHVFNQPVHSRAERGVALRVRHCCEVLLQPAASLRNGTAALQ